jgi:hypothetical protein
MGWCTSAHCCPVLGHSLCGSCWSIQAAALSGSCGCQSFYVAAFSMMYDVCLVVPCSLVFNFLCTLPVYWWGSTDWWLCYVSWFSLVQVILCCHSYLPCFTILPFKICRFNVLCLYKVSWLQFAKVKGTSWKMIYKFDTVSPVGLCFELWKHDLWCFYHYYLVIFFPEAPICAHHLRKIS